MAPEKEQYVTEMLSALEKGQKIGEFLSERVGAFRQTRRTLERYWAIATERHLKAQQDIQRQLATQSTTAALKRQEGAIISKERRMEIASKIAEGEIEGDKLRALDYLSRIDGDYAPIKKDLHVDSTVDFIINIE